MFAINRNLNVRKIVAGLLLVAACCGLSSAQGQPPAAGQAPPVDPKVEKQRLEDAIREAKMLRQSIKKVEQDGVEVRIKDVARFRGVRGNQLLGYGLVVGLEGTGDTRSTPFTQTLLANALRDFGTVVDPTAMKVKNVAVVAITAELPAFASPGNRIDITVQSIGDAKSLQGGTLLQAPLYGASNREKAYAVAQGYISIGGFSAGGGGNSVQKNHQTVGRVPAGGIVEASVPTKLVFDGKMYLELDEADFTTAQRLSEKLALKFPDFMPHALHAGTIELSLPEGKDPVAAMSMIESATVFADIPAVIVINERTGTIVIGGNVKVGPAAVAKGSLNISVDTQQMVNQPDTPFTLGTTAVTTNTTVQANEEPAKVAMIGPVATVDDLARIFQALRVSPTDIIAILQALRDQGALKARIKIQ